MTAEQIRALHRAQPFQPFDINLADGRSFSVTHPEAMWQTPAGRTIVVSTGNDAMEIIDLLLVTSLSKSNGKHSGKSKRR